jgi:hypothetical protein
MGGLWGDHGRNFCVCCPWLCMYSNLIPSTPRAGVLASKPIQDFYTSNPLGPWERLACKFQMAHPTQIDYYCRCTLARDLLVNLRVKNSQIVDNGEPLGMPLTKQWSSLPDAEYDSKQGISLLEGTAILSIWETGPLRSYPYCKMSAIVRGHSRPWRNSQCNCPRYKGFQRKPT